MYEGCRRANTRVGGIVEASCNLQKIRNLLCNLRISTSGFTNSRKPFPLMWVEMALAQAQMAGRNL